LFKRKRKYKCCTKQENVPGFYGQVKDEQEVIVEYETSGYASWLLGDAAHIATRTDDQLKSRSDNTKNLRFSEYRQTFDKNQTMRLNRDGLILSI